MYRSVAKLDHLPSSDFHAFNAYPVQSFHFSLSISDAFLIYLLKDQ